MPMIEMTEAEFMAEGVRRFGPDPRDFKFSCPSCGHVATARDYEAAGAPESAIAFSCVGRWLKDRNEAFTTALMSPPGSGPCNYAGDGLFKLNPVHLTDRPSSGYFAFADGGMAKESE